MAYPYTMKDIVNITGKSSQSLHKFVRENKEFINQHTQVNGRFVNYDEDALQMFIKRFGRAKAENQDESPESNPTDPPKSVIDAFEAQIKALTEERDQLLAKLANREADIAGWRDQAGQALSALSKEQDRVEKLEERLAGYLPASSEEKHQRKLTLRERITGKIKD